MDKNKETETMKKQEEYENEASRIFRKAFYEEAAKLEKEADESDLEIDEDRMEALYQRIRAKVAETESETDPTEKAGKTVLLPRKTGWHALRWVAVLALVCAGVFGVSMQSQAGKDGLWSSIQRLIGTESHWEQKNNDENREYSDPDEVKAVRDIEDTLGIVLPEFFYWPDATEFSKYEINEVADTFTMIYQSKTTVIYFEGWRNAGDASAMRSWETEGEVIYQEYGGTKYSIVENSDESTENKRYYLEWSKGNTRFSMSGLSDLSEVEKILKNIKN